MKQKLYQIGACAALGCHCLAQEVNLKQDPLASPVSGKSSHQAAVTHMDGRGSLSESPDGPRKEVNTGQDFTRPVRRFDLRYQYQVPVNGLEVNIATLRMDWPVKLSDEWTMNTRLDVPSIYGDVPSRDNPDGDYESGSSDLLAQFLFIHPLSHEWAAGVGTQVIFPTASQDQFGGGVFRAVPTLGIRYAGEWMPKGWWVAQVVRYDFNLNSRDSREPVSDLILQPILNVALPHQCFATFAPEMKYSFMEESWFVPFDVTLGHMLNPTTVISLEYKQELLKDLKAYDWAVEFRVGFFF